MEVKSMDGPQTLKQVVNSDQTEEGKTLLDIAVPYVIEDKTLMSPGTWNYKHYNKDLMKQALKTTDFSDFETTSLFTDHDDDSVDTWVGEVHDIKLDDDNNVIGDLYVNDPLLALKLDQGAEFGISPRLILEENEANGRIEDFQFDNFSIVLNPAVKTAYINNEQIEVDKMTEEEEQEQDVELSEVIEKLQNFSAEDLGDDEAKELAEAVNKMFIQEDSETENEDEEGYPYPYPKAGKYPYPYPYPMPHSEDKASVLDEVKEAVSELKDKIDSLKEELEASEESEDLEDSDSEDEESEEEVSDEETESEEDLSDDEEEETEAEESEEELSEDDSDEDEEDSAEELSEKDEEIEELQDKVDKLTEELSEPNKKSEKLSNSREAGDPDKAMLEALKSQ